MTYNVNYSVALTNRRGETKMILDMNRVTEPKKAIRKFINFLLGYRTNMKITKLEETANDVSTYSDNELLAEVKCCGKSRVTKNFYKVATCESWVNTVR